MKKIKHERTADCVVAGYRVHKSGEDRIGSLLLGLYRDDGKLASVGVIGAFPMEKRIELFAELQPLVTTFDQHPWNWAEHQAGQRTPRAAMASRWNADKDLSFTPLRPERVVEVRYDHMEGPRFRHPAGFYRARRPQREPASSWACAKLEEAGSASPLQRSFQGIPRSARMTTPKQLLELAGHEVAISNQGKVYFPRAGVTKLDMVRYYLAVAPGALGGVPGRPMALKRFVNGAEGEPFFQKRAPEKRPDLVPPSSSAFLPAGPRTRWSSPTRPCWPG